MPVYKYHTKKGVRYCVKVSSSGQQFFKPGFLNRISAVSYFY